MEAASNTTNFGAKVWSTKCTHSEIVEIKDQSVERDFNHLIRICFTPGASLKLPFTKPIKEFNRV